MLRDASEQAEAQNWLPLEIHQIDAGRYTGCVQTVDLEALHVCLESQSPTVHKTGMMGDRFCTVSFARTRGPSTRFSEFLSSERSLFFLPSGTEFDVQVPRGVETVYFRFEQSALLDVARVMNPARWEVSPSGLQLLEPQCCAPLAWLAAVILERASSGELATAPETRAVLTGAVRNLVLMALSSSPADSGETTRVVACRRARPTVRRAIAHAKAEMATGRCPSVADLCCTLKVSERSLQYAFKTVIGLSPNTYLRRLRLNRVRADLLDPSDEDETVTRVAMRWHFLHLSRFSRDYQRFFGELPSTTLGRSLGPKSFLRKSDS